MPEPVFIVDVFGQYMPEDVTVIWQDEQPIPDPRMQAMIDEEWAKLEADCRAKNAVLFNGKLLRHIRHETDDGRFTIHVGPTDYAAFMGTNFFNPHRADEFGWENYSNAIGTSATVITDDGWLLLGRRNERVACMAGYVHTFGGGLEPDDRRPDGTFDIFAAIRRELQEELSIGPDEIRELVCMGLIRDRSIRQPELIFNAYICSNREDVLGRLRHDDPHEEHESIVSCRDTPQAIVPFIRSTERIAPVAVGALCQHGRKHHGPQWYDAVLKELTPN